MIGGTVDFWIRLVLGHCTGDYGLQTAKMALGKGKSWRACAWHCTVYTASVAAWLIPEALQSPVPYIAFIAIVFASHLVLDKTPVVQWWLKKIGSRTFENAETYSAVKETRDIYKQFYVAFAAIVHAVLDNALHFLLMYLGLIAIGSIS
jgi:hypothetical protein